MMTRSRLLTTAGLALGLAAAAPAGQDRAQVLRQPPDDAGVRTLETRRDLQLRRKSTVPVFVDFSFTDRQPASGLDFVHRSVDDSLRDWKPVHYDHGNGIAVADVDGDSRYDVYLSTQLGANRLYRNLGGGRFADITDSAGVALADRISVTASFADADNDGDPDLFVTTVRFGNVLFENLGQGRFRDVTAAAGLGYVGHSSGSTFFDYDNDGWLDLFVANVGDYTHDEKGRGGFFLGRADAFEGHNFPERTEKSLLYRNLGGLRFENVTAETGLEDAGWTGDATIVDFDRNGFADLYALNMQGDDHYWVNRGGERFVDDTARHFPKTPWGAMGVGFFDYDNDGDEDLLVTDMHSDMHTQPVDPLSQEKIKYVLRQPGRENSIEGNAFYEQGEPGAFEEISDLIGAENYWPWGLSVGDLNADGFQDVFIASSMNYPFRYGINTVLINDRGRSFLDAEFMLGVEPRRGGRTHQLAFTVDCDGADKDHRVCADRSGRVQVEGALGTRASVIFDLDGDGDLDIVTNEFNDSPQVLVSNLAERAEVRFLEVRLIGKESNRDGLGARVTVRAGDDVYMRFHDGKSGYLSQSSMPLYFGLGSHQKVDSIEVVWPSGTVQTLARETPANQRLEIVEEPADPKPAP